jgi:membrane-associated phospholipid phosphatase
LKVPLLVLLIITAGSLAASAADSVGSSGGAADVNLGLSYFMGYFSDAGSMIASPLSWGGSEWLRFSAVIAATYAVASEESEVQTWVQVRRNGDTNTVARFAGPLGSGRYVLPALIGLYGCGRIAGSDKVARTALLSLESVVLSGVFTGTIKYLTHKQRPNPSLTEGIPWNGPSFSGTHLSFPSGHSTCGFAVATVVAMEYGDHAFVPPLVYCAATLAALSRVNDNAHWMSDIILGSAIGHFTARAIVGRHGGVAGSRVSLIPAWTRGSFGLALSCKF